MASLASDQPPISNGINRHAETPRSTPVDALLKAAEPADAPELSTATDGATKNVASFESNESVLVAPIAAVAPANAESDDGNKGHAFPVATLAGADMAPKPDTSEISKQAKLTEDEKERALSPEEGNVQKEEERPVDDMPESAEEKPSEPEVTKPLAALEEKPLFSPTDKPALTEKLTEEPTETPSGSEDGKDSDVDMVDASAKFVASKTGAPLATSAPAVSTSAYTTHTSSLLPSLRDDPPRDNCAVASIKDTTMIDAPTSKIAREREDDDINPPSAKRPKTEGAEIPGSSIGPRESAEGTIVVSGVLVDSTPVTMPARERAVAKEGSLAHPDIDNAPISEYANREIRRVLASVKKTKAGHNFKDPVHKKWPALWESYTQKVARPVDISQLERNLRDKVYASHAEFVDDVFLIFENSVSFNGVGNPVTDEAKTLVDNFFTRLSDIPASEPQKLDRKEPKQLPTRHTEPRAAAARRESRGAATSPIEDSIRAISINPGIPSTPSGLAAGASVTSPGGGAGAPAESSTPVFAVPSSGVPIIRRDSAKNDGDRPKRPIHPPKNRDLGYEPKNTKKKQPEFRFCEEVLKELTKAKHYEINHWFLRPVDPVAMQIPTYHKVIKKPMDLGTMQTKLNLGEYIAAKDFENDFSLIVKNCRKFNIEGEVVNAADRLEELFKEKWADKDNWIAAHTVATVVSPTAGKDEDSDEDAEDSDDDADEISVAPLSSETVDALVKRLAEENERLNKLLLAKIPDMTMITTQQVVLNMLQKQIVEEKTKLAVAEAERRAKRPAKAKGGRTKKAGGGVGSAKKAGFSGGLKKAAAALAAKKGTAKARVLGQAEKNVVTDGINNLDGGQLEKAIDIIKRDTSQEESAEGELELDIDQLSQDALGKLYDLIVRNFPHMRVKTEKKAPALDASGQPASKPSKPKKHKPMGKLEQERNIEKLREIKAQFQRPGSGSQEPLPSVEANQSMEAEESEEESDVDSEEE